MSLNGDTDAHIVGLGIINGTVGARRKILGVGIVARQHLVQQDFIEQGIGCQLFQKNFLGGDDLQNGLQRLLQRVILGRAFQTLFPDNLLHILQQIQLLLGGELDGKNCRNGARKQDNGQT